MKERVIDAAHSLGLDFQMRSLEVAGRSPAEVSAAIGCSPSQVAQAVVFIADGDPVLAVASGSRWLDLGKLCDAFDCAEIRQATADEVRAATGCSVVAVSPLDAGLPVAVERALLEQERIYVPAGDGSTLFEVDPQRLASCIDAQVIDC